MTIRSAMQSGYSSCSTFLEAMIADTLMVFSTTFLNRSFSSPSGVLLY